MELCNASKVILLDVNLTGTVPLLREAVREFIRRGVVKERSVAAGKIVYITLFMKLFPGRVTVTMQRQGGIY